MMIDKGDIASPKYGRFACSCCPYGYHIDLDFVKYCESLTRVAPTRRVRRRQRQSMDIMMGFAAPSTIDSLCATDALADAVCKFELTLLSTQAPTPARDATPPPKGGGAMEYVRQQMAHHLARIGSLEEQLKVIPALRLQIDMLTEEKRRLEARLAPAPRLSRDVGVQSVTRGVDVACLATPRVATKQSQSAPRVEHRDVQTLWLTRDAATLTECEPTPPAPVAAPALQPVRSVSKAQQTEPVRRTVTLSKGLQVAPQVAEVRLQTDGAPQHNVSLQVTPDATPVATQTALEAMQVGTQTTLDVTPVATQTDELALSESESEMEEEEEEESIKSPLSAINEDTEERETYTSATTRDSDSDDAVVTPSRDMLAAVAAIGEALERHEDVQTLPHANATARREWFHVASTEGATAATVRAYLAAFAAQSAAVVTYMATLADANGNTALHYAISHGNFAVVGALLDSGVCDVNRCNNAGYTAIMLVSLVALQSQVAKRVVERLFRVADVNLRARKHGQTALMLAVSHGNVQMVSMLIAAGADVNAQDEDGSTALMCAVEHGKMDIVKVLLAQPNCDSGIQDMDGSTALKISLDAGFHDIGILLYAHSRASRHRNGVA